MLDIHNANLSFWSPQPQFIGGFFFPQQMFQLAWLYRLYKLDPKKPAERTELDPIGRSLSGITLIVGQQADPRVKLTLCPIMLSATSASVVCVQIVPALGL